MEARFEREIANEFITCVDNTIERIRNNEETYRPFHAALLSDEVLLWSRFERSFSTSFGQRTIERIAEIAAMSNDAKRVQRQKETTVKLDKSIVEAITQHETDIRSNRNKYRTWDEIMNHIASIDRSGVIEESRIISDLWWIDSNGVENFISLKTVKPNIDQTVVAKMDCLRLKFNNQKCNVYFGLPYNPYGEDKSSYAHNPPMGVFDFHNDEVVLIGKELWDTIGGEGCYETILKIAREVGEETRAKIEAL